MLALLALLAFAPLEDHGAGGVRSGEPAPHLSRNMALQWRLDNRARWAQFQSTWGGRWAARWDERTGAPRFLYAPGVPGLSRPALVEDVARLAGVDPAELSLARQTAVGDRLVSQYTRRVRGALVVGDQVAVVEQGGLIGGVWVQLSPVPRGLVPAAGEVLLPLSTEKGARAGASTGLDVQRARRRDEGDQVVYWSPEGAELLRYDTRMYGTGSVSHRERTIGDAMVTHPAREVTVTDASGSTVTDSAGAHGLSGPVGVTLTGPAMNVRRSGATVGPIAVDSTFTLTGGGNVTQASAMVLHHYHAVRDWLAAYWPTHSLHTMTVQATVDMPSSCNAYYSSGTINFYSASSFCYNFGEVADVIYHEVGHGIHHYILAAGTFAGDVSEGSADYVSSTILGDAVVGKNSLTSGGYIRELETDRVYPTNVNGEVHNDGLIWGSFLWNLRAQWSTNYGATSGVAMTDALFLNALSFGPTLTDLYEAVLLSDDDNGDLSDSTPHACELKTLLDQHGIGPGPIGVVSLEHTPLGPQASAAESYPVSFDLYDLTSGCSGVDLSSVKLYYTAEEGALPVDILAPAEGEAVFAELPLTQSGSTFTGELPRQPATTQVRYFITVSSTDGTQTVNTHDGKEAGLYSFWVGDQEAVWCEDFESGATDWIHGGGLPASPSTAYVDQWEVGVPTGQSFDPTTATSGTQVIGTNLDGNYVANNQQFLLSPVVDSGGLAPMLMLSFQRFLTVEDGIYDVATMRINGVEVFTNGSTAAGTSHLLDADWALQEIPLEGLLEADDTVGMAWTLTSDPGLEFGGWSLDDVCVVRLADVPGHYRVRDLVATDDEPTVRVSWSQPWMKPLAATALVRKRGSLPVDVDDGLIVDLDLSPIPGEWREVEDPDAEPGDAFYYALFAAGVEAEDWYTEVVEGENADQGGIPAPEEPEDTSPPVDTSEEDPEPDTSGEEEPDDEDDAVADEGGGGEKGGCSSAPGAQGSWVLLALAALGLRRRARGAQRA